MMTPGQLKRRAGFYGQLASTIAAGLPLIQSLQMAGRDASLRGSRKTVQALIAQLQAGHTFTDSLKKISGWLPDFDVALLSAGENSGRLDVCFKQLSNYYANRAQIIHSFISRLATTLATLHVFLLVFPLSYLIAFAQGIFDHHFVLCLPFIVEKIAVFGILYGFVFSLIFAGGGQRGERWRAGVESLLQKIPLLRTAQKNLALARLTTALDALTNAGVNVTASWELAAAASGSPRLKHEVSGWAREMENGMTPADLVNRSPYFPEMFANLFHTGEMSGQMDETLARLQTYYQEEGFNSLQRFARILNGVIYAAIVLLVAYNIIRFWVHYYNAAMNAF